MFSTIHVYMLLQCHWTESPVVLFTWLVGDLQYKELNYKSNIS